MPLSAATGSFNIGTGIAGSTVAVSGLGFQPSVVLFWWSGRTGSVDGVGRGNQMRGFGWATSPTSRHAASSYNQDLAASSQARATIQNAACIVERTATLSGLADLQAFDADGFTLVIDAAFTVDYRIHYLALGGSSLTNAATGSFTSVGTAPVNQAVTGLGFQPSVVFFLSVGNSVPIPTDTAADSAWCLGAAVSATQEAVWMGGSNQASATMQTISYCRRGECIVRAATAVGPVSANDRAEFVSMDAGGFTINWLERAGSGDVAYLALAGVDAMVADLLTQTDTVTPSVNTGCGFTPAAALFVSHGMAQTTQDDPDDHDRLSIGAATSATSRHAIGTLDEDNTADCEATQASEFDAVYVNLATDSTVQGLMDVQSFDSDGFTAIMDDADPSQAFVWYLAFGPAGGGATPAEGSGIAALALSSVGVGYTASEGTGTSALALVTAGAGAAASEGSSAVALSLSSVAAGETVHTGTASVQLALSATGAGVTAHEGAGTGTLSLSSAGASSSTTAGFGVAVLTLNATAAGQTTHTGLSTAAFSLSSSGQGYTAHEGVSISALTLSSEGSSTGSAIGSAVAALSLSTTGTGARPSLSSATVPLSLGASGTGTTAHVGSGAAALTLTSVGLGDSPTIGVSIGSGVAALSLTAAGAGSTDTFGIGQVALALTSQAQGFTVAQGSGIAPLSLGAAGVGYDASNLPEADLVSATAQFTRSITTSGYFARTMTLTARVIRELVITVER